MPPDFDAALSALRRHVDNLAVWIAIWEARAEPDAHARRCGSDAVDALDAIVTQAYRLRARLTAQIRISDRLAADRADELLTRLRDGPPGHASPKDRHNHDPATTTATGLRGQPASGRESSCPR